MAEEQTKDKIITRQKAEKAETPYDDNNNNNY